MSAPRPAIPEGLPKQGDVIAGKYRVEGVLGAGGMGIVVSALHVALGRRVAVKFLSPAAQQVFPDASARFVREARAAMAIKSEHVTRVLDVGELDGGSLYIVMELLTGLDLSQLLKSRGGAPLPVDEAVDMVLQAGEAIAEAHSLGIIHRDLKLTNLFCTTDADGSPFVKVLDFGLSKLVAPDAGGGLESSLTLTSVIVGSPHYMSPEQIRSLKHADARSDIWALGVILYQLASARRPFRGHSLPSICMSVATDTPKHIHSFLPGVPPALDDVIQRCLDKDVNARVQTVAELAEALAPFASPRASVSLRRILRGRPSTPAVSSSPSASPPSSAVPEPPRLPLDAWSAALAGQWSADFLPWLQGFDAFARVHGGPLGLDEASLASLSTARAGLERAVRGVDHAAWSVAEAERRVARAEAAVAEAERRCGASQGALGAAVAARERVVGEVLGAVRPIVEHLLEHDDITGGILRQMGLRPPAPPRRASDPAIAASGLAPPDPAAPPASPWPSARPAPAPPRRLLVLVQPGRTNVLEWASDGAPGTSYVIEAAVGKLYRGTPVDPESSAYRPIATVVDGTTYRHVVGSVPAGVRVKYRIRAGHGSSMSGYSAEVMVACK
ncbi:serine/threonine-protein kinase [Sorangium sp. So ce315]|uniref:serine/threonine-protein kinase n=1 Tax=Sorangium sp. So ce315 TaxID=3133299 RepID=UPI003F60CCE2